MDVSSVHWPGFSPNGPRPIVSSIGMNVPGLLNSSVVAKRIARRQSQQASAKTVAGRCLAHKVTPWALAQSNCERRLPAEGFRANRFGKELFPSP